MKFGMKFRIAIFSLICFGILWAQFGSMLPFPAGTTNQLYARGTFVPSSLTGLIGSVSQPQTVKVNFLFFANQSSSLTATITVTDQSTDCGGTQCQLLPAVTLAPNTAYFVPVDSVGMVSKNGFAWMATGSTSVFGYVRLSY
jgi:hypothetical protein